MVTRNPLTRQDASLNMHELTTGFGRSDLEWSLRRKRKLLLIIITRSVPNAVVGLERGSLSLVSTTEELLDRKVAAPV
jgi:hypothetical protein